MARIKITASELENVHSQLAQLASKAETCASLVASVRNSLDMEVAAKRDIGERLKAAERNLSQQSEQLRSYANVLSDVVDEFERADSRQKAATNMTPPTFGVPQTSGFAAGANALGRRSIEQWTRKINDAGCVCGVFPLAKGGLTLKESMEKQKP